MDIVLPPDLRPQAVFMARAEAHARSYPLQLLKHFSLRELNALKNQGDARRESCLRQLQQTGRCDMTDLKASEDPVSVSIDRHCVVVERQIKGKAPIAYGLPKEISELLPKPQELPAKPLACPPLEETKPEQPTFSQGANNRYFNHSYAAVTYRFKF